MRVGDDGPANWPPERSWLRMFADALRGVAIAVRGEVNFAIHLTATAAVIAAGLTVGLSLERWCLLGLCITVVLAAEMLNTAIEHLARAVSREENTHVRDALDVASASVLVAATGATLVGAAVFVSPLVSWLS